MWLIFPGTHTNSNAVHMNGDHSIPYAHYKILVISGQMGKCIMKH
jgi:hypothetical protein